MLSGRGPAFLSLLLWTVSICLGAVSANVKLPCGEGWTNVTRFQVLPGGGWDNLRNVEMPAVFQPNYTTCVQSVDGRYLLPTQVRLLPNRKSNMEIFSEIFEHYYDYRSLTASTINAEAHGSYWGFTASGSYSREHQHVKTTQLNTKSITARTQLRYNLYTALLDTGMPLSEDFRNRLLDIAFQLKNNNSKVADYIADTLVADYGTHYITRIDAGGVISRQDFVKSYGREMTDEEITKTKASASAGFGSLFGVSGSWSSTVDVKTVEGYEQNVTDSQVASTGGIPLKPNITINQWSDSIYDYLVPVDRAGNLLFEAITPGRLGELPYQVVGQLSQRVKNAIQRYYKANVVKGCMVQGSDNFNPLANVPDADCKEKRFKFAFGGVFQTCSGPQCGGNAIKNIITDDFTCPSGYQSILLHQRTFQCDTSCHGWWVFKHCSTSCSSFALYWCAADYKYLRADTGYLFGGLYSNRANNPMTGQKSCPSSYLTFTVGAGDVSLCLSRDFELGEEHAFDFGGFFSCLSGNPYPILQNKTTGAVDVTQASLQSILLAKQPKAWPTSCPKGYAQHLAAVDGSCEIMFCAKAFEFKQVTEAIVQSPPFVQLPAGSVPKPRLSSELRLDTEDGSWVYDIKKSTWQLERSNSQLKTAVAFLGSLFATVCLGSVIAGVIFMRRRRLRNSPSNSESQRLINDTSGGNGGTQGEA